ncbi:MAG: NADH-quinone oxidoreductase subunit B family protein [Candidatus Bathyarchaeia archaeon]
MSWARSSSSWLLHFNSGSCNGCDIELVASRAPKFDLERFGILVKGSPRHADILAVTGPVTRQTRSRLLRIYGQMPEPKYVIAIGSCALSGAPFIGSYNVYEGVDKVLPVDVYVGGCPPRPEAIIHGVLGLIGKIRSGKDDDK